MPTEEVTDRARAVGRGTPAASPSSSGGFPPCRPVAEGTAVRTRREPPKAGRLAGRAGPVLLEVLRREGASRSPGRPRAGLRASPPGSGRRSGSGSVIEPPRAWPGRLAQQRRSAESGRDRAAVDSPLRRFSFSGLVTTSAPRGRSRYLGRHAAEVQRAAGAYRRSGPRRSGRVARPATYRARRSPSVRPGANSRRSSPGGPSAA